MAKRRGLGRWSKNNRGNGVYRNTSLTVIRRDDDKEDTVAQTHGAGTQNNSGYSSGYTSQFQAGKTRWDQAKACWVPIEPPTAEEKAAEEARKREELLAAAEARRLKEQQIQTVREAFDPVALAKVLTMPTKDFTEYAVRYMCPAQKAPQDEFYFKNNDSPFLAVAHLDSVEQNIMCSIAETANGPIVFSGALDDRLGAYVILELLPKLGITFDWLLTTGEEVGQSTAAFFKIDKEYQWIVQFDRGGTDCVMYKYETPEWRQAVKDSGADVGHGSFSDICYLEHLGCKAVNWGVGYRDYHGPKSHAWLNDVFMLVAQFVRFHEVQKGFIWKHEKRETVTHLGSYTTRNRNNRKKAEHNFWPRTSENYYDGFDWDTPTAWDALTDEEQEKLIAEVVAKNEEQEALLPAIGEHYETCGDCGDILTKTNYCLTCQSQWTFGELEKDPSEESDTDLAAILSSDGDVDPEIVAAICADLAGDPTLDLMMNSGE